MKETITWHGHSNFQLACNGLNICIDPFFTGNPKATQTYASIPAPDLVLVTHNHTDHVGDAIALCKERNATLVTVVGIADKLVEQGVPENRVHNGIGFNIGGTVALNGVSITMTEAFHTSDSAMPVGFIITLPSGYTIYHAGDTGIFGNMTVWGKLYPIDLALLPIGGTFTMDHRQAALATQFLQAKAVIPMHYGTFPVLAQNTQLFEAELKITNPHCKFININLGETLPLPL